MSFDVAKRAGQYVALRDRISDLKKKHEAELQPYMQVLAELNTALLKHLDSEKVDSMKTSEGTVYVTVRDSASVADSEVFFDYVRANEAWELMERRANVTAVRSFIDEAVERAKTDPSVQPTPPPGVNFSRFRQVGVRRS